MKRLSVFFLLVLALTSPLSARFTENALREPMGVRAAGLGGAFTAVADDASALFYNPAGLADPGIQYASGMMDNSGSRQNLSAYSVLAFGPLAYGERRIASKENELANIYSYAFAQRGTNGINWGIAYKRILEESFDANSDQGWAADLGMLFKITPQFNLGVLAQNISSGLTDVVPNYRVGAALQWLSVLWSVDQEYCNVSPYRDQYTVMHYGLEKEIARGLTLRFGSDNNIGTAGFSIGLPFVIFEYAMWDTDPQMFRFGFKLGEDKYMLEKDRSLALFKEKDFVEIVVDQGLVAGRSEQSFLGGNHQGGDVLREQIQIARKDREIGGMILRIGPIDSGLGMFGTVQEIREELERFKKENKKIIAYIESDADYAGYYLASVADKIVMPAGGSVGLFGLVITPVYAGKLLDKFGIQLKTISAGKYKADLHIGKESLPTESRKLLMGYLDDVNAQVIAAIKKSRNLDDTVIAELKTGKLFTAKKARDLKLIDELGHYAAVKDMVKDVAGTSAEPDIIKTDSLRFSRDAFDFSYLWPWPRKVAIIDIDGEIVLGKRTPDMLFGSKQVGADDVCDELQQAADDLGVKAIILRINSPGGSAIAADQIYQKILDIKEKKKKIVVASCGNIAASGGYYIACAADKIIANHATILGSIGVYQQFPLFYGLLQKLEINAEALKTGESVDMFSGFRDLSVTESELLQESVDDVREQFVLIVAKGRKLGIAKVENLAQGQIFTGRQSKLNGLIDETGNFTKALLITQELADIKGDVDLVRYIRMESLWKQISYRFSSSLGIDRQLKQLFRPDRLQYKLNY